MLRTTCLFVLILVIASSPGVFSQNIPKDVKDKVDQLISEAYKTAEEQFPCKVKPAGAAKIARWQDVDKCLNRAAARVDWEELTKKLESIRAGTGRVSRGEFTDLVEASLSAHAVPFEKVFEIKNEKALIPLTNSLLRFLPADSLHDLPVFNNKGERIGLFAGTYTFERTGGLATANTYKLTLFQYSDANGNIHSAADRYLLYDSYGVPWTSARKQPGYRLTSERLPFVR